MNLELITISDFFYLHSLQIVEPIKLGAGQYGCPFCSKMCGKKQHMTYHIRKHTGEQPFACELCDKKFSRKENRAAHIRNIHRQ